MVRCITEKLLKSFLKDVRDICDDCKTARGSYTHTEPSNNGIFISLSSSNGYTYEESEILAKKSEKSWKLYKSLLSKYNGYINEDEKKRYAMVSGEGEYGCDYGMELQLYFNFGDKILKYDGTEYFEANFKLYTFLRKLTNDTWFPIKDKGDVCSIGKYFEYNYATGEIIPIDRVNPYPDEVKELSKLVKDLLVCVSDMPVPINTVWVNGNKPYSSFIYFYAIGDECVLWHDVARYQRVYSNVTKLFKQE